ncbi:MAG TPA: antibiotic biosynthesis monooxygenase family protein [Gemmatimonadales bacterium]|jgi:heme-degrading monooxygenase HmoA|nr:antibiotic biosynthesis monooxygenase family protein [Gemmatimonadales bacterium]
MILALFAFRLRSEAHAEFERTVARMVELVRTIPGFISLDLFRSEDGRTLAVPRFESEASLLTWRNHPEHLKAQHQGIELFFDDYWIDVCSTIRSYEFHREDRTPTPPAQTSAG